jgi:hypothetical protein
MPLKERLDRWLSNWLVQNTIVPHKMLLSLCLGFIAAGLPLAVNLLSNMVTAIIFLASFTLLILVLFFVKPKPLNEIEFKRSRWGIFSMIVLGFGIGALSYRYRSWLIWLWHQFRRINEPHEWILVSLFLLGVILGFFVVRNWPKNQQEFISSLTAVVGAAFVSTILGNLASAQGLTPLNTFAYYSLGFGLSGTINLIVFSLLVARYSRTNDITSRSVIDFLYGSDKAQAIDGYFLKNYENDPDYAKVNLLGALNAYREIIRDEFAKKMCVRKERQEKQVTSPPVSFPTPTLDYFELLSIESKKEQPISSPPGSNQIYELLCRKLNVGERIKPEMLRVSISMKWNNNLEYIVRQGQYMRPFPLIGSVAGLALNVNQTIVMDRDEHKKFRGQDFVEGRSPDEVVQPRGLTEADYLSYIVVPMVSSFGKAEETPLGVLHVDTKLFVCPAGTFPPQPITIIDYDHKQHIYKVECTKDDLEKFRSMASDLYEQQDEYIQSLENFRGVIVPLLELYLKCRIGTS